MWHNMATHLPAADVEAVEAAELDDLVVVDSLDDVDDSEEADEDAAALELPEDPGAVLLLELELDDDEPTQLVSLPDWTVTESVYLAVIFIASE